MHQLKVDNLLEVLKESDLVLDYQFRLEVNAQYIREKEQNLLREALDLLGGKGHVPTLDTLKFDFKIGRQVFVYDDEAHFNRYRLNTFKSDIYDVFSFPWLEAYKRLCRNHEKDCLKTGMQERLWNGPPIAAKIFGKSEEPGDLSGNGSSGWKLNAYNDVQYDLVSRLHGFKLVRIPVYENIMIGGSLKKIDDLLLHPKEEYRTGIRNWFLRKVSI
jgi:hypothetical protein